MPVVTLLLCFRTTRTTPSELLSWSTFINGLDIDMKNDFVSYFPRFECEGIHTNNNSATPLLCYSESASQALNDNDNDSFNSNQLIFNIYPESIIMSQVTKYLNRLEIMGFTVISSTVDNSSLETNCMKKCYMWTLQTQSRPECPPPSENNSY